MRLEPVRVLDDHLFRLRFKLMGEWLGAPASSRVDALICSSGSFTGSVASLENGRSI